jgi:hypothetical protein
VTMAVTARFGGVAGENGGCGDRDQPENTNPQNTRGSQGCAKHKLPRPNFCLDHRFVRPNYAQRRRRFPCSNCSIQRNISGRIAVQAAILAKRLYANAFLATRPERTSLGIRLGARGFQKIKQPLRNPPVFGANPIDLCVAQISLTFLCAALYRGCVREPGPPGRLLSHQSGKDPS